MTSPSVHLREQVMSGVAAAAQVVSTATHSVLAKHLYAVAIADHERDAALLMYYGGGAAELFTNWYRRRGTLAGRRFQSRRKGQPSVCA